MPRLILFDERIQLAAQLVVRARIFYDLWWFYENEDTRSKIIGTLNEYSEFFRFDVHAHFVAYTVYIAALFERRSDTVNLAALVREAERLGTHPRDTIAGTHKPLAQARPLSSKVAVLRSNLFAHRNTSLSYAAAFGRASVSPDELRELTDIGLRIVNLLLAAKGLREQCFHELARSDAERLFCALSELTTSERAVSAT
jgi:AbiU2